MSRTPMGRTPAPPVPFTAVARMPRTPRRHIGRWVAAAVVVALLGLMIRAFAAGQINWAVVGRFLTAESILSGLGFTLVMTVLAMLLGIGSGVLFAVMKMADNPVLQGIANLYIWLFRGTPLLLQLLLWFNLALVFPTLGIPGVVSWRTVDVMTPFVATLLGLGLNQGAYTAEVVRAGILSIDAGQTEAAKAIGMGRLTTLRRIVLPQAMRVIIPPVGNEVVSMVKLTAMASVIQYPDILRNAQTVYYANGLVIELLLVASFWYLLVVTVLSIGQSILERHFSKGQTRRRVITTASDTAPGTATAAAGERAQ